MLHLPHVIERSGGWGSLFEGVRRGVATRWRRKQTLSGVFLLAESLEEKRGDLTHLSGRLEEEFLKLGESLMQVSNESENLLSKSEDLLKLATGQIDGEDEFRKATEGLKPALQFLDEYKQWSGALTGDLRRFRSQILKVCDWEREIDELLQPLKLMQVLFRIESARLPAETRAVFLILTENIQQVLDKAGVQVKAEFEDMRKMLEGVDRLIARIDQHVSSQSVVLKTKELAIEDSMKGLEKSIVECRHRDMRLTSTVAAMRTEVGRVVQGIQVQDFTRQQLEKLDVIFEDVSALVSSCGDEASGNHENGGGRTLGKLNMIALRSREHLEKINSGIHMASETTRAALETILKRTQDLKNDCMTLHDLPSVASAGSGMVDVILNVVSELRGMIVEESKLALEVQREVQSLSGLAGELTVSIWQLSFGIKLIALNAQVQAAQLTECTGLEVLSQRTCVISDGINSASQSNATLLSDVNSGLEKVLSECRTLCDRVSDGGCFLKQGDCTVETQLHAFRDRVLKEFTLVNEQLDAFARLVRTAAEKTAFPRIADGPMQSMLQLLDELSIQTVDWAEKDVEDVRHAKRKTVVEEESASPESRIVSVQSATRRVSDAETTEVEWFDVNPSTKKAATNVSDGERKSVDPVSKEKTVVAVPVGGAESMGDNVELF